MNIASLKIQCSTLVCSCRCWVLTSALDGGLSTLLAPVARLSTNKRVDDSCSAPQMQPLDSRPQKDSVYSRQIVSFTSKFLSLMEGVAGLLQSKLWLTKKFQRNFFLSLTCLIGPGGLRVCVDTLIRTKIYLYP